MSASLTGLPTAAARRRQAPGMTATANPYVSTRIQPSPELAARVDEFTSMVDALPTYRPVVGCIIPAYNEEESIGAVIDSLLAQTRLPDVIHVVVNNTTDRTVEAASAYAGPHTRDTADGEQFTEVFVHDIGKNPDKKVGALNYGFYLVEGCDYLLGVDGDTTAQPDAVQWLVDEIASDTRIGGISAVYSIDDSALRGVVAPFLVAGQRAQFAAFNMQNLLRGRNMAVLGGQFSIFSITALREVIAANHQSAPWVKDSEIEDSLLSLQIKSAGYLTKISANARADVGGMTTLRALDAQQVKWNVGAIDLMWPGQRGDTKGQPLHPNLRLRWAEHLSMLVNALSRVLFITLLAGSLSIHAWVFSAWWLAPPAIATMLNVRVALSMHNRTWRDVVFAIAFIPAELYMWVRLGHFLRAWAAFASRRQTDNWAAQARAERGRGWSYLAPLFAAVGVCATLVLVWFGLTPFIQSIVLWIGWPILGTLTIVQSLSMLGKVFRRHHGFQA